MKVLFAVSNEEISESIVKKYQKEYKQIISYKNVYYFNAIVKELQKDKSYDRIVISEDLEAFTHTQYDQIDKFIFEKLDSISDEASNLKGNDTPIILICSDRRAKSETMLVKLFGIGIYNAILGNDRSVDEVCRLINRPRVKKEAKTYYKIDTEEVNYQAENENDVSEMEIQNIVAHYKRLGKNEERYVDSFNNIAAQYNDTQLRIITKFLPLNVRAVLEEKSPKYQQIMSFNNSISNELRKTKDDDDEDGPSQVLLKSKNRDKILSKPVVIPSSVNMSGVKKLTKTKIENKQENHVNSDLQQNQNNFDASENVQYSKPEPIIEEPEDTTVEQEIVQPVKRGRGRPKKIVPEEELNVEPTVKRGRGRPKKTEPTVQEEPEENFVLPGLNTEIEQENQEEDEEETYLPGFEPVTNTNTDTTDEQISSYQESEYEDEDEEDTMLPGFEREESNQPTPIIQQSSEPQIMPQITQQVEQPIMPQITQRVEQPIMEQNRQIEQIDLSSLLTPDKKVATFVGTSKNGTSFIVNNLAELMSSIGINTAILDTTQNRNSYYIYTKNEEPLREIATHSIEGLAHGIAKGISVNKNLTVYTSLPDDNDYIENADKILETLLLNHSLILIDTDFNTPINYFKQSQETYLVQTMDILTIQPLTAFLKQLKAKNVLDESKLRIVLNKVVKIRGIKDEVIIGGMAFYNDPGMSFMTELFDRDRIKYVSIPFEEETYIRYLEGIIDCEVSLKGYSKVFLQTLRELGNMIYPIISAGTPKNSKGYQSSATINRTDNFSDSMNRTLDQMKRNY